MQTRRGRRRWLSLVAVIVALATAGRHGRRFRRCRPAARSTTIRRRDRPDVQRERRGSDQRRRRRRRADRRQAGGAVGDLPPAGDERATTRSSSRSFAGGAWTTRGIGTVGGRSSASPTFTGSLNFDQGQDGEAPAIDFAGSRPDGAVGDVVRGHDRHRLRRQQHLRQPLRQHRRREPGQVDLRRPGPRQRRRQPCRCPR